MTRITKGMSFPAPSGRDWPPASPRTRLRRRAGAAKAAVALAALAIAALATDSADKAADPPVAAAHRSRPPGEGSVDETGQTPGGRPTCSWASDIYAPLELAVALGGPPAPGSTVTFERCDGEWTGRLAWLTVDALDTAPEQPGSSGASTSADR